MIFGGIHATLYPDEALDLGGAHAVVRRDGDVAWPLVLDDAVRGTLQRVSKLYRQMNANTGIATDSARVNRGNRWARLIARPCRLLFTARPLPSLQLPATETGAGVGTEARA